MDRNLPPPDPNHAASNKRQHTSSGREAAPAQTTVVDTAAAVVEFIVNYGQVRILDAGKPIFSDAISAGGHMWRLRYHLNNHKTKHVCIVLEHLTLQDFACLSCAKGTRQNPVYTRQNVCRV